VNSQIEVMTSWYGVVYDYLQKNDFVGLKEFYLNEEDVRITPLYKICVCLDRIDYHLVDVNVVIEFVKYLTTTQSVNSTFWGRGPLFYATEAFNCTTDEFARKCTVRVVNVLLDLKASVHNGNIDGETPLLRLLEYDRKRGDEIHNDLIWLLVNHGANMPEKYDPVYPHVRQMINGRKLARHAALIILGIKRYGRSILLKNNNMDAVRLVAQCVWETRIQNMFWDLSSKYGTNWHLGPNKIQTINK